jgi:hypothetical protein
MNIKENLEENVKYSPEENQKLKDYFLTSDETIADEIEVLYSLKELYIEKRRQAYTKMYAFKDEIRVLERKLGELGVELLSKIDDK